MTERNERWSQPEKTEIEAEEVDLHDYAKWHRGTRRIDRILIEHGVHWFSHQYSFMGAITMVSNTITIEFPDYVITITGKNLQTLLTYLNRHKVAYLTESEITGKGIPSYVENISIESRE